MIDTAEVKQNQSILSLAERHSELRKLSGGEWAGPCPNCHGVDRFHVHDSEGWFFCRQCHGKRGDVIELVQWLGLAADFREAVELLSGQAMPAPATKRKAAPERKAERPAWQQAKAEALAASAHERLFGQAGEAGQQYLLSRGLEAHTWLQFGLGFVGDAVGKGPAISLPWYAGGKLVAIRYRLLEPIGSQKLISEPGSRFSRRLFGGQSLLGCAEDRRCLVLCEGELNAASIWQAAHLSGVDVLSLGSESQRLTEAMIAYAGKFGQVIAWADRAEVAAELRAALPGSFAVQSPKGRDANDLLQQGLLGGFLATARAELAAGPVELERLLLDLVDGAGRVQGTDASTALVIGRLAAGRGKVSPLIEIEAGRWVQAL